jgi:hypothetical protein
MTGLAHASGEQDLVVIAGKNFSGRTHTGVELASIRASSNKSVETVDNFTGDNTSKTPEPRLRH